MEEKWRVHFLSFRMRSTVNIAPRLGARETHALPRWRRQPLFPTRPTPESIGYQAGIMADRTRRKGKSRRVTRTVHDFRRHLSLLLDVEILVISTISSETLTPHCVPVLKTRVAQPLPLGDFQTTGRNGWPLPACSAGQGARTGVWLAEMDSQ